MIYVLSDLHGHYEKYRKMLDVINLRDEDLLYILGDVIDRGPDGIKILLDMMMRENVIPMLGNHEYMAYTVLENLNVEITEENYNTHLNERIMDMFHNWMFNGGQPTCSAFTKLSRSKRESVLEYLCEFELYNELEVNGNKFVLVHGGLSGFDINKELGDYSIKDIVWDRCDYAKEYFPDRYLVTGHTPTEFISPEYKGRIYKKNNHIAIDCGGSYDGTIGCICLDTMEEFYVE